MDYKKEDQSPRSMAESEPRQAVRRPTSDLHPPSSTGLHPRTAATLAYLAGPFSGALILLAESRNADVRFHAWQSIVGLGGLFVGLLLAYALGAAALFVSATAATAMVAAASGIWIMLGVVWAICLWKAYAGKRWRLPIAGDYAERFAASRVSE
jgi:uncharacterized membrane protein